MTPKPLEYLPVFNHILLLLKQHIIIQHIDTTSRKRTIPNAIVMHILVSQRESDQFIKTSVKSRFLRPQPLASYSNSSTQSCSIHSTTTGSRCSIAVTK